MLTILKATFGGLKTVVLPATKVLLTILTAAVTSNVAVQHQESEAGLGSRAASNRAAIAEQIIELPEDGDVWHTSLFLHDDWESRGTDRRLVAWFATDSRLVSLKSQTRWHLYTPSDPIYRQRFEAAIPQFPAVVLQRGNGEVIFKATGENLSPGPEELASSINRQIRERCPGPYCRPFEPQPITPTPPPEPIPDLGPEEPAILDDAEPVQLWLLVLAGAASLGIGVASEWRKET